MKYNKKLHKILDVFVKLNEENNPEHRLATVEETHALLDEIERLQEERRWIPESGAPINRRVYVLMPNNYVVIATKFKSLCKDPNHYLWRNDSGAICQVICWMPLPPPPDDYVGDNDHEHDDRIL